MLAVDLHFERSSACSAFTVSRNAKIFSEIGKNGVCSSLNYRFDYAVVFDAFSNTVKHVLANILEVLKESSSRYCIRHVASVLNRIKK